MKKFNLVKEKTYNIASSSLADWYEVYGMYKNDCKQYVKVHIGGYNTCNMNFNIREAPVTKMLNQIGEYFNNDVDAFNKLFELKWSADKIRFKKKNGIDYSFEGFERKETWKMPKGSFPKLKITSQDSKNIVFVGVNEYLTTYTGVEKNGYIFMFQTRYDGTKLVDCIEKERFFSNLTWNDSHHDITFDGFKYLIDEIKFPNIINKKLIDDVRNIEKSKESKGSFFIFKRNEITYEIHKKFYSAQ